MRKKKTRIATINMRSKGPIVLSEEQQREFATARKHPDKGGYPGLKAMFKKHGCEPK